MSASGTHLLTVTSAAFRGLAAPDGIRQINHKVN